ncbi:dihydropteroate synthase [Intrasporangium sp.]|uniref:dihydropteroate synthase n=1 Tax=Intrasporangium sp. TaxID=1925024 RepID=UPI00293A17A9|nr:dihydropteroate synthase [Intrasporangium sp.]MDV3220164.1 dihydropteroate synthase [Intrasporangium sp.]
MTATDAAALAAAALVTERDRTLVMGVVNVTPDSFSDGGVWFEPEAALAHGRDVLAAGADIVDVGGESTRPGAERPTLEEELRRVLPVVTDLAAQGAVVSIDTMRAPVAAAALEAGAGLVNDVSGGRADPDMVPLVVEAGVPYIAMHWRGHSSDMQSRAVYDDVVADVCRELGSRRDELLAAGLSEDLLVLDPGLGFAKTAEHNWAILAALPELHELGQPILLGASRKAFLGRLGRAEDEAPRPAAQRDLETTATSVMAAMAGLWCVRVHDVESTVRVLSVVAAALDHLPDRDDHDDHHDGPDDHHDDHDAVAEVSS